MESGETFYPKMNLTQKGEATSGFFAPETLK